MVRALGDRSGTTQKRISVSDPLLNTAYHPQGIRESIPSWDQDSLVALAKYRKQYRKSKEAGWHGLPFLSLWKGLLVVDDGTHRWAAAILEGATDILADVAE